MTVAETIIENQTRSSADIRDAIYDRIAPFQITNGQGLFTLVRKTAMPTLQPAQLPAVSVFLLSEESNVHGDYNSTTPLTYLTDTTIGISVARAFTTPDFLRGQLEYDVAWIQALLLTDPTFAARRWPGQLFEGVPKMRTTYVLNEDQAEAYMGELRLEMTFRFHEEFAALVFDEFREMAVRVHQHGGPPDVKVLYRLWQDVRRRRLRNVS